MTCTFTISFYIKNLNCKTCTVTLFSQKCGKLSKKSCFMCKRYDKVLTQCRLKAEEICFPVTYYFN